MLAMKMQLRLEQQIRRCKCSHEDDAHEDGTGRCTNPICGCKRFREKEQHELIGEGERRARGGLVE